ncbi:MAG: Fic family protein [Succinivibrio sp.]|nr:Fic family protein [Succinivibrio sp.]
MDASEQDYIYCYRGTEILINKYQEKDPEKLKKLERLLTGARLIDLLKNPMPGEFELSHLRAIHRYIFQDLYEWAGELRRVDISKASLFCHASYIEKEAAKLFVQLKKDRYLHDLPFRELCAKAAFYLGEINAIHPFRDGNGRAQREFIRELLLSAGYSVDYTRCRSGLMFEASVASFQGDYQLMMQLFEQCTVPLRRRD